MNTTAPALTVTDLFAGAGGSSEGMRQAGFKVETPLGEASMLVEAWDLPDDTVEEA